MKYSLIDGVRREANPGLKGHCPACGSTTIAKCGNLKIWHWAHKGTRICDQWWENETDWHRNWKNCFPVDWQESIHYSTHGEKHIADVKTAQGYVIEFQHSHLKEDEQKIRTDFYEKIVWVVDGARRGRDINKFFEMIKGASVICKEPTVKIVSKGRCGLFREWYCTQAPVFFDFGEEILHCLLPNYVGSRRYFVEFPRRLFVALHNKSVESEENTFEDCLKKLYIYATEHRRNELYRIKTNIYFITPEHKFTENEIDIWSRTSNHLNKLDERFKVLMEPYFRDKIQLEK